MTTLEKSDAKLALIVLLTALFIGFLAGRASACDSFESCIEKTTPNPSHGNFGKNDRTWDYRYETSNNNSLVDKDVATLLRAIAYKIDEISRDEKNKVNKEWMLLNKQIDLLEEISKNLDKK